MSQKCWQWLASGECSPYAGYGTRCLSLATCSGVVTAAACEPLRHRKVRAPSRAALHPQGRLLPCGHLRSSARAQSPGLMGAPLSPGGSHTQPQPSSRAGCHIQKSSGGLTPSKARKKAPGGRWSFALTTSRLERTQVLGSSRGF